MQIAAVKLIRNLVLCFMILKATKLFYVGECMLFQRSHSGTNRRRIEVAVVDMREEEIGIRSSVVFSQCAK